MKTLSIFAITLFLSPFAMGGIHERIDNCNVTSNSQCLKKILHRIARIAKRGGRGGRLRITPGAYTKTGNSDLCPQSVSYPSVDTMKITYTSPCSGGSDTFTCQSGHCSAENGRTAEFVDRDNYVYTDGEKSDNFSRNGTDFLAPAVNTQPIDSTHK